MIEVSKLTKRYGTTPALRDVSFSVADGAICGLLGPNGAGKSTTMNIMTGCIAATSGEVRYDGLEIYEDRDIVKRQIGYLPEQPPLYPDMTPFEYLHFVARAKGIARKEVAKALDRIIEECGISEVGHRLIKYLSKGYRQRVGIAQALLGDPHVVILDEPTVGLDPLQIIEIRALIKELGRDRTIIVSSHILSEIRTLCNQIVIIAHGQLIANDTPEGLERAFAGPPVTTLHIRSPEIDVRTALDSVPHIAAIETVPHDEEGICALTVEAEQDFDIREELFCALTTAQLAVVEFSTKSVSLEEVFVNLTRQANLSEDATEENEEEDQAQLRDANQEHKTNPNELGVTTANVTESDADTSEGGQS